MEQDNIEQDNILNPVRKVTKKSESSMIRFHRSFMRKISKLVDRANKKPFGRKVKPGDILENLFHLADDSLLAKTVKKTQEDSLSHSDKREVFLMEKLSKFNGSKEQLELKMMEVFDQYLSQNQS